MSFRIKLLVAMMLVVGIVTTATLFATQHKVQGAYEEIFQAQFQSQITYFAQMQEARLSGIRQTLLSVATSIRGIAAMNEYLADKSPAAAKDLYDYVRAELFRPGTGIGMRGPPGVFRILDDHGQVIPPPEADGRRRGPPQNRRDLDLQLEAVSKAMSGTERQQVGYLAPANESTDARLHEVVLTKIIDTDNDSVLGAVVMGFEVSNMAESALSKMSAIQSGVFLDGEIHSKSIPASTHSVITARINDALKASDQGRFAIDITDRPHTVLFRALNEASAFPRAYQVCVYSLDEPLRVQREMRAQILLFGGLAMVAALAVSLVLSHGLSGPIRQLVAGTRAIERGELSVRVPVHSRDELGELAQSFNQMTEGLALKEKYRSVLDMVSDPKIAEDLIHGKIELGGEEREVSVLFCDIRGFTAATQNMEPPEVIQMLNEHFTPLTKVVKEHHGVVDKFVGDLIMAIFGAPTTHGNEPLMAARCALRMIEERQKLNENSKYKLAIGIGIATGKAVAGRMGSQDRLNYTVLGPRVNLASRLCSQAGRMEVVIDETTFAQCCESAVAESLPPLKLKGFSDEVQAYKLSSLNIT